ncbi:MAG: hypothetical protein OEZ43_20105 [Gammaproteobacteria bacterium]|nr:hypothetical protein [Gammaproteobacteria bacterium]
MKNTVVKSFILLVGMVLLPTVSSAEDIPLMIPYAGEVSVGGEEFDGTGLFKFAIVNRSCTVNAEQDQCVTLWSNDGSSVKGAEPTGAVQIVVSDGDFQVKLGDTSLSTMTAIPASVFSHEFTYLRTWFDDGTNGSQQLTNDRQLVSVPYAYRAEKANNADRAVNADNATNIVAGGVTTNALADGAVGATKINKAEVQARVGSCDVGSSIRAIDDDGNVTCETDNGDQYTAGAGISLNSGAISIADNGVNDAKISDVTWGKLSNVPAGFADGTDDGIVAESDPTITDNRIKDGVDWSELSGIPPGFADNTDNVGLTVESDPTITDVRIKDGVDWSELSGIPPGFADNTDNVGLTSELDPTVLASVKDGVSWTEVTEKPIDITDGDDDSTGANIFSNSDKVTIGAQVMSLGSVTLNGLPSKAGYVLVNASALCVVNDSVGGDAYLQVYITDSATGGISAGDGYAVVDVAGGFVAVGNLSPSRIFTKPLDVTSLTFYLRTRTVNANAPPDSNCRNRYLTATYMPKRYN